MSFTQKEAKNTHKLIIGDNFDALQNLLISYKNKIDVIYIDPPYGKDDMGEFADTNYYNAITRDSLLSMLYPRLVLAKQLLSDEGVKIIYRILRSNMSTMPMEVIFHIRILF